MPGATVALALRHELYGIARDELQVLLRKKPDDAAIQAALTKIDALMKQRGR